MDANAASVMEAATLRENAKRQEAAHDDIVRGLEQEAARLWKQVAQLEAAHATMRGFLRNEQERVAVLTEALRDYGEHRATCPAHPLLAHLGKRVMPVPCDCGLDEIRARAAVGEGG